MTPPTRKKARRKVKRKPKSVSEVMASIHSKDTRPEMVARRWLWTHGYRYRKNVSSLPGKPDIVITTARTAIFIHGCFWHQHEGCRAYSTPHTNTEFWQNKFARNKERDERVRIELRALGWRTMVIWECQLKPDAIEATMEAAARLIEQAKGECRQTSATALKRSQVSRPYEIDEDETTFSIAAEEELTYGADFDDEPDDK